MERDFYNNRLNDHKNFYCPNGHCQRFVGKTEAEELRERLHLERVRNMELREESNRIDARRRAAKAQLTRLRRRIDNGTCPYCNRHFENVQRHISCKHKDASDGAAE
jgi:hypothetical protein